GGGSTRTRGAAGERDDLISVYHPLHGLCGGPGVSHIIRHDQLDFVLAKQAFALDFVEREPCSSQAFSSVHSNRSRHRPKESHLYFFCNGRACGRSCSSSQYGGGGPPARPVNA